MTDSLLQFSLTALTTLFVVVDPFGVLPIFVTLVQGRPQPERARIITRAVAIGFGISMFFLLAGHAALRYLGVSVHAFAISGGVLLFATAVPMLFGHRPALQAPERGESGPGNEDISIFPLAIPLLAGPGTITSILLLAAQARSSIPRIAAIAAAIGAVFLLTHLILGLAGERLVRKLGAGGVHVVTRVLGILLAALAVQFILNGISDYVKLLQGTAARGGG